MMMTWKVLKRGSLRAEWRRHFTRISPFVVVLFKNGPAFPLQDLFLAPIAPIVPPGVRHVLLPRPRSSCRLRGGRRPFSHRTIDPSCQDRACPSPLSYHPDAVLISFHLIDSRKLKMISPEALVAMERGLLLPPFLCTVVLFPPSNQQQFGLLCLCQTPPVGWPTDRQFPRAELSCSAFGPFPRTAPSKVNQSPVFLSCT